MTRLGMGSHQSAQAMREEWLTPPHILQALGKFDRDPCAPLDRPWPMANDHYTIYDNGLALPWTGRVWLNPPYGNKVGEWLNRLADHGNGIALVFARTECRWFFSAVWPHATALLFLRGRLSFHHPNGSKAAANSGAPSVLVAYGENNARALANCGLDGKFIDLCSRSEEAI